MDMNQKILGLFALVAVLGCESKNDSLLNNKSEESIRVKMDVRLKATHSMRKLLDRLELAASPVDGVLDEVSRAAAGDFNIKRSTEGLAKNVVAPKLKELLKKARRELVHVKENGTFFSDTLIEWPREIQRKSEVRGKSCAVSALVIAGSWSETEPSQVTVTIDDCMSRDPLLIAEATLVPNRDFRAEVYYANLGKLAGKTLRSEMGSCVMTASENFQEVNCLPFSTSIDSIADIVVTSFHWENDRKNVRGRIDAMVFSDRGDTFDPVNVVVTYENGKPRVELKKL